MNSSTPPPSFDDIFSELETELNEIPVPNDSLQMAKYPSGIYSQKDSYEAAYQQNQARLNSLMADRLIYGLKTISDKIEQNALQGGQDGVFLNQLDLFFQKIAPEILTESQTDQTHYLALFLRGLEREIRSSLISANRETNLRNIHRLLINLSLSLTVLKNEQNWDEIPHAIYDCLKINPHNREIIRSISSETNAINRPNLALAELEISRENDQFKFIQLNRLIQWADGKISLDDLEQENQNIKEVLSKLRSKIRKVI